MPEITDVGMIFPKPPPIEPLPPRDPMVTVSTTLGRIAPRRVLVAVLVVAVAAAMLVPTAVIGIGIALTGIVVLAAVLGGSPGRPSPWELVTAVGIVALLGVAGWRGAQWLAGWSIVLAVLATMALLVDAKSLRDMMFALIAPATVSPAAIGWIRRGVATEYAGKPIRDPGALLKVGGVTVVLVIAFGALFAGADATFASLLSDITPDVDDPGVGTPLAIGLLAALCTALGCYLRHARPRLTHRPSRPAGDTWTWAVPTGTVLMLFVAFLVTQARGAFGDDDYIRRTSGLTYADYARSGFWQLFTVTALTIAVVTIGWQRAGSGTRADRVAARVIFGGLCVAALAVVWSALYRMNLYMDAYGATRLRVSVMAIELWLGAILVALIVAGIGLRTRHLPRAIGVLTVVGALAFAVYNPDAQVARANVERFDHTGKIDVTYLSGLSPDATGALLALPADLRGCVLESIADTVRSERGWTEFNVGRRAAAQRLAEQPTATSGWSGDCVPK